MSDQGIICKDRRIPRRRIIRSLDSILLRWRLSIHTTQDTHCVQVREDNLLCISIFNKRHRIMHNIRISLLCYSISFINKQRNTSSHRRNSIKHLLHSRRKRGLRAW